MVSDRLRPCDKTAAYHQVGSRSRYRQRALAGHASSSQASSSLISVSGYDESSCEMLAAMDDARLDAEDVRARLHRIPAPSPSLTQIAGNGTQMLAGSLLFMPV